MLGLKNDIYSTAATAWRYDYCHICRAPGDPKWNTTCFDCKGIYNGPTVIDACGVCGGDNACVGCDGVPALPPAVPKTYDACGVCGGANSTCYGCDGVINSGVQYDRCGICNGDGMSCVGCPGETAYPPGSPNNYNLDPPVVDACGVCGGQNKSCYGCDNVRGSNMTINICGNCTNATTPPACLDCTGLPFGTTVNDACGNCGGKKTSVSECSVAGPNPAVIAGATIGATVAVVAAAMAIFLFLMRKKIPNWVVKDYLQDHGEAAQHNPLYEGAGAEKSNALYVPK